MLFSKLTTRIFQSSRQHRKISTFHVDSSVRGRLQPYLGTIRIASAASTLFLLSIGGLYLYTNHHLDTKYPEHPDIKDKEIRKLLRGAALREHIAPDPRIAYMFLQRALELIYKQGDLSEDSEAVQEVIARLADAAAKFGEQKTSMLYKAWSKVVNKDGEIQGIGNSDQWRMQQVCRLADTLGPLQVETGDYQGAITTYGTALRAMKNLNLEEPMLKQANYIISLGEAFALSGDLQSSYTLLSSVLVDLNKRPQTKQVDRWTCLDSIVMLDIAQVEQQRGNLQQSQKWAESGLEVTSQHTM
ncbi:hypothetical protein IWW36_003679, partial [Coemansia brasiliensis]